MTYPNFDLQSGASDDTASIGIDSCQVLAGHDEYSNESYRKQDNQTIHQHKCLHQWQVGRYWQTGNRMAGQNPLQQQEEKQGGQGQTVPKKKLAGKTINHFISLS